ncbi:iron-sulfur cluster repair di-iron protein [Brevibacillus ginsengisoli]|uniref:iron-sulfur cluster repair di-iron protein n=1 Tax=Brevibacillus ginsengisoli TaxID=363854 RepID=UPI003CF917CD
MEMKFNTTDKIGEIVARFPGASNIFKEYKIDFCCGGNRPLAHAFDQLKLNGEEVLNKLQAAFEDAQNKQNASRNWKEAPSSEIIEFVVNTHHAYLTKELPLLSEFVTKIMRVHGPAHPELSQLHRLFHSLKLELEQHLVKEEEILFPLIRAYEAIPTEENRNQAFAKLNELESEHELAGNLLKEMRAITNDYTLPEGACRTYTITFHKLAELESDLFEHIHLENNILFPRLND